jgi:hypothetical protein
MWLPLLANTQAKRMFWRSVKKLEDLTFMERTKAWIAKRKSPPRPIPQINGPDLSLDKVRKAFERVASKRAPLIPSTLDWPAGRHPA